jgi:hypothetical protein
MSKLDRILATLPDTVDWPEPSEHLAARIMARVEAGQKKVLVRLQRWVWAAGVLIVLVVALIPGTRQAVADLFQEAGVRIGFVEEAPTDLGQALELGDLVTMPEAETRVDFDLRHPEVLGPPEETYIDEAGLVSMMWDGPVLLTQRARGASYAEKRLGSDTSVADVVVAEEPGLWVEGVGHSFTYLDAQGNRIEETTRLAGNVLLWSADGVDHRLELSGDLSRALEIAESMMISPNETP